MGVRKLCFPITIERWLNKVGTTSALATMLFLCGQGLGPGIVHASFEAAPFFPIHTGDTWTYTPSETITVQPGTVNVNGVDTKVLEASGGTVSYYTNDSNGIRLHRLIISAITITFSPPITVADAVTDVGAVANSSGTATTPFGPAPYTAGFTVQSLASVPVPLRTFDNAVRVDGTITVTGLPFPAPPVVSIMLENYLARNIGLVKSVQTGIVNSTTELTAVNVRKFTDFDGDGRTDVGVYETSMGNWFLLLSTGGFGSEASFGGSNFVPVPGDYDGDGITDVAVYDKTLGEWFYIGSTSGLQSYSNFGGSNFVPVPGDYDGDGITDRGVYDTATGNWFIDETAAGHQIHPSFGGTGYVPVPGDYDGDGQTDIAVYEENTGAWCYVGSTSGIACQAAFGGSGYIPVPGDYDGDGTTDLAVYDEVAGHWFIIGSTDGLLIQPSFGGSGYIPVPDDYDGDGITDTAVYETATGNWFVNQSTDGFTVYPSFGGMGYMPVLPQVTILTELGLL